MKSSAKIQEEIKKTGIHTWKVEEIQAGLKKHFANEICEGHASWYYERMQFGKVYEFCNDLKTRLGRIVPPAERKARMVGIIQRSAKEGWGGFCRHMFVPYWEFNTSGVCCFGSDRVPHWCNREKRIEGCSANCLGWTGEPVLDESCGSHCVVNHWLDWRQWRRIYFKQHPGLLIDILDKKVDAPKVLDIPNWRVIVNTIKTNISNFCIGVWEFVKTLADGLCLSLIHI